MSYTTVLPYELHCVSRQFIFGSANPQAHKIDMNVNITWETRAMLYKYNNITYALKLSFPKKN